jgi:hypothetical protein
MKLLYNFDKNGRDLKLRVSLDTVFDGHQCLDFEIVGITLVNFKKEVELYQSSKLYQEIEAALNNDYDFLQTIEQAKMSAEIDHVIDREYENIVWGENYA